jgi:hypothetical protein
VQTLVEKNVVLLETDFDRILPLQKALEFYRVAAPVRFAPRPVAVLALVGEEAEAVLRRAGIEAPAAEEAHALASLGGQPVRVARAGDLPGPASSSTHPRRRRAAWTLCSGRRSAPASTPSTRRIEALRPWWGTT